jgi:hypothetical protein
VQILQLLGFPPVKLDVAQHQGVALHVIALPATGPQADSLRKFFGPGEISVTLGIGPEGAYFAAGANSTEMLKKALDDSSKPSTATEGYISVALAAILKAISEQDSANTLLSAAAASLAGGKDKVIVKFEMTPRGGGYRIELEEGVLKMFGALAKQASASAAAVPAPATAAPVAK